MAGAALGADGGRPFADALAADPSLARALGHVAAVSSFATDLLAGEPSRLRALTGEPSDAAGDLVGVVSRYAQRSLSARETGEAVAAVADRVIREAVDAASPDLPFRLSRP